MEKTGTPIIEARNVVKKFKNGKQETIALDNLNLKMNAGEFNVIVGPSGCGKSTFLYMLAGFEQPTEGEILLNNRVVTSPGPDRGIV
ncbi:MAG: ATP-binding cassette domain-containing protein, partial [Candidatus Hodarchaeales archaeon]